MCGRFTLAVDPGELRETFSGLYVPEEIKPRYNISPTQPVAVILNSDKTRLDFYLWGLIPSWAKDPAIGNRMINARAESLTEKPSFRNAYRHRRCLIPATGFYEWQQNPEGKGKIPFYFRLKSGKLFAFAGLWEVWNAPDGSVVYSCAIITTQPNDLVKTVHSRMPVILPIAAYTTWIDTQETNPTILNQLLVPYPAQEMEAYPVSRLVNSPDNDLPECIQSLK